MESPLPQDTGHTPEEQVQQQPVYPPKPHPADPPKGNPFVRFLVSVALFGAAWYFLVSKNIEVIIWLAGILLIHELGHYLAMKAFRYQDLSIFFLPLVGAAASGSKEQISQKEKAIVLLAGPLPGIIIGLILYLAADQLDSYYWANYLTRISFAFVLLNMFNLLPIYPLDGGQLVKTLFIHTKEIVFTLFIVLSIAAALWFAIAWDELFILIIPFFMIMRLLQQIQIKKLRKTLEREGISYHKSYSELSGEEYWRIRDHVAANSPVWSRIITPGRYEVSEKETSVINFIKALLLTHPTRDLSATGIIIIMVIWLAGIIVPLMVMQQIWNIL